MATKKKAVVKEAPAAETVRQKGAKVLKTVGEMTNKELFDAYCRAKRVENASKKQAALFKEIIAARTDKKEGDYVGDVYTVIARAKARAYFKEELAVKFIAEEDLPKCYSTTEYMEYRVKGQEDDLEIPEDVE